MSNFYPCSFIINGQQFHCSEQAYQFIRAKKLGAPEAADKVMRAKDAKECKKLSYLCTSNPEWDREKRGQMKTIVQEKFFQNEDLQNKLLSTGVHNLFEATTDTFWGTGVQLGSKSLNTGRWTGLNTLGQIICEVREDVKRTKGWEESHTESREKSQASTANPTQGMSLGTQPSCGGISTPGKKPVSFVPANFDISQSSRGRNNRNKKRGRGGRQMTDPHPPPSIYAAHAQSSNQTFPAPSQIQMHNQCISSQVPAGTALLPQSLGNINPYTGHSDPQLNLNQYQGMYGNMSSTSNLYQQPQLPGMINYQGAMTSSQNQQLNQSIYAHFGHSGNQTQAPNSSFSNQAITNESSIYPNQSFIDQSMCINSPLPLKAGVPVTTAPPHRSRSSGSNYGSTHEVMSQSHSPRSSSDNDGTSVPPDNVFLGPVASV